MLKSYPKVSNGPISKKFAQSGHPVLVAGIAWQAGSRILHWMQLCPRQKCGFIPNYLLRNGLAKGGPGAATRPPTYRPPTADQTKYPANLTQNHP
jgi:hypothetical protein